MAGQADKVKGKIKKILGKMTNNEPLKREGQRDEISGTVKEKFGKAADQIKKSLK
jgi:CsbD-like.